MLTVSAEHITKTPGICGGKACIAGHRIRVMDIVALSERGGLSPDEIADQYPGITLADVHAALAYYFDHREEIAAEFRRERELADQYRDRFPSKVRGKLGG
ncbi:MAG: DUF433 domain-containing protein [Gemmataceae bacterium]|nr:DUF433 domain-containing protein [Gemmataceae bacterium]